MAHRLTASAIRKKHSRSFSSLAIRKPYPLLSKTPCELAYIKPCKCCQLQPYVHLNPHDPDGEKVRGSLDPIMPHGSLLEEDTHDIGEVAISEDGLLHPESACESYIVSHGLLLRLTTVVPNH